MCLGRVRGDVKSSIFDGSAQSEMEKVLGGGGRVNRAPGREGEFEGLREASKKRGKGEHSFSHERHRHGGSGDLGSKTGYGDSKR